MCAQAFATRRGTKKVTATGNSRGRRFEERAAAAAFSPSISAGISRRRARRRLLTPVDRRTSIHPHDPRVCGRRMAQEARLLQPQLPRDLPHRRDDEGAVLVEVEAEFRRAPHESLARHAGAARVQSEAVSWDGPRAPVRPTPPLEPAGVQSSAGCALAGQGRRRQNAPEYRGLDGRSRGSRVRRRIQSHGPGHVGRCHRRAAV